MTTAIATTAGTVARFLTLAAALVTLDQGFERTERRNSYGNVRPAPAAGWPVYTWHCTGCRIGGRSPFPGDDYPATRDAANTHAAACRAIPHNLT